MDPGDNDEQQEARLVDALIAIKCVQLDAVEVSRTFDIDEDGTLVINSTILVQKPVDRIKIDLTIL